MKENGTSIKTLYIIRHGETELNRKGIVQGRGVNSDLNEKGERQAEAFYAKYKSVPFDKIYTSTLKRTHQSVKHFINDGIDWEQLDGLDELGWGEHEGKESTDHVKREFEKLITAWQNGQLDQKPNGGESPIEVTQRQQVALSHIMSKSDETNVLVCMHGRALRILLCALSKKELHHMDVFPHSNLTLYKIETDGHQFSISTANNTDHLKSI